MIHRIVKPNSHLNKIILVTCPLLKQHLNKIESGEHMLVQVVRIRILVVSCEWTKYVLGELFTVKWVKPK